MLISLFYAIRQCHAYMNSKMIGFSYIRSIYINTYMIKNKTIYGLRVYIYRKVFACARANSNRNNYCVCGFSVGWWFKVFSHICRGNEVYLILTLRELLCVIIIIACVVQQRTLSAHSHFICVGGGGGGVHFNIRLDYPTHPVMWLVKNVLFSYIILS